MPLHGVSIVAGVEMLEDESDTGLFGMREDRFPGLDTVGRGFFVVHAVKAHSGEGDDTLAPDRCGDIDAFFEIRHNLIAELGIAGTFGKPVAADERDLEAELFDGGVVFARDALHRDETDCLAMLRQFDRFEMRIKTPAHDGLADTAVFYDKVWIDIRPFQLGE